MPRELNLRSRDGDRLARIFVAAVDHASIRALLLWLLATIVLFAAAFLLLSPNGNGIRPSSSTAEAITFADTLYFSVVTISSLGYRDFVPEGIGRGLAACEVMAGLVILTLLIGKLASERTDTLVKLLYAESVDQRLKSYKVDLLEKARQLDEASVGYFTPEETLALVRQTRALLSAVGGFVGFHTHNGLLLEVGAKAQMRALLKNLVAVTDGAIRAARTVGAARNQERPFARLAVICSRVASPYVNLAGDSEATSLLNEIKSRVRAYQRELSRTRDIREVRSRLVSKITEGLLLRVADALPPQPWPKNIHKHVATKLGISNSLAHKAISHLVDRGAFERQGTRGRPA